MSGSLSISAPIIFRHAGGNTAAFGGTNTALAWRLRITSNAGNALIYGTKILDFQDSASSLPAAYYYPSLRLLYYRIADSASATWLVGSLPIQIGTNYHFLISWKPGIQTLYINGQVQATTASALGTYTYHGLMMGGDAGTDITGATVAMDHMLSDVAIWTAYAPTAAEALSLANGSITPSATTTPAAAWWPLGGGSIGSHPSAPDLGGGGPLTDATGNGNSLVLDSGAYSGATYQAVIPMTDPIRLRAMVTKWGWLAFLADGMALYNGDHPPAVVTGINAQATAKRNGTPVALGPPIWFPLGLDGSAGSPVPDYNGVHYQPLCGGVSQVAIADGGAGYSASANVSVTAPGGFVAGPPTLASGVTGYTLTNRGSGYNQPPKLVIADPGGGTGALGYIEVSWAGIAAGVVFTAGGSGYTSQTTLTLDYTGTTGENVAFQPIISGGQLVGANVINHGDSLAVPPQATVDFPPSGTKGPQGYLAVGQYVDSGETKHSLARVNVYGADAASWGGTPGTIREVLPNVGGLLGCGSGYVPGSPPNVVISQGGGTGATATAVVSNYIAYVPVTTPGDFTSPPTLTVTDSGGTPSRAAVLRPMMAGFKATDAVTYSAPASWLALKSSGNGIGTGPIAGLQAATDAPVSNYLGVDEPDFAVPRTMQPGCNHGIQPNYPYTTNQSFKNKLHCGTRFSVRSGSGTLTQAADGTPVSWTSPSNTVIGSFFYGPDFGNFIDDMSSPAILGPWTVQYDDPNVNTASAVVSFLTSRFNFADVTLTPVMLSGPASPVTIPAGNLTLSGGTSGSLTGISLSGLGLVAGWQGAAIQITGGNAANPPWAMVNVQVSGGIPTSVGIVCGGTFTDITQIKALLYGTAVSGTQVTHVINVQPVPTTGPGVGPSQNTPSLEWQVAQSGGSWTVGNPWIVAPDVRTGAAVASIDRTKPLAMDDAVVAMLKTATKGPGPIRWMDAIKNGPSNIVNSSDIFTGTNLLWQVPNAGPLTLNIAQVRCYNTDPAKGPGPTGDGTYGWVSQRVYGPQAMYCQGPDTFGNYIQVNATDNGVWIYNRPDWGAFEMVTATPHGWPSEYHGLLEGSTQVPMTDSPNWYPGTNYVRVRFWVTGPMTLVFAYSLGGGTHTTGCQRVNSTTPITVDWHITIDHGTSNVPVRYAAAASAQIGCPFWYNAPDEATDTSLTQLVTNEIVPFIGNSDMWVEVANEVWNKGEESLWAIAIQSLINALPAGVSVLGYTTDAGTRPNAWGLRQGHIFDVIQAAWTAAGKDPTRLHVIYSGWGANSAWGQNGLDAAMRTGRRADYMLIAMYTLPPFDPPFIQAIAPAGSAWTSAGSIPVSLINDIFRYHMFYSIGWRYTGGTYGSFGQHGPIVANFGQPIYPLNVQLDYVNAYTGNLPNGAYYFYYTYVDGSGRETTVGYSQSNQQTNNSTHTLYLDVPPMPSWATAINLYCGKQCAPGPCSFYQQITRAMYTSTNPCGSVFNLVANLPSGYGTQPPPTTNLAAANTPGGPPKLVMYEYSPQNPIPSWLPTFQQLNFDMWMHPSAADLVNGINFMCQHGDPSTPSSGAVEGCYFECLYTPADPNMWLLTNGVGMLAGDGVGHAYAGGTTYTVPPNRYATIQGGAGADGHDHAQVNTSPMLLAYRNWIDAYVATPTPTPTPTSPPVSGQRRMFPGMGRVVARVGR